MTIVLLGINMAGHLFRAHHTVGLVIIILEALVLLVLLIFTRDFNRASDKRALGVGIIFVLMGLYAIFLSASSIYFDDTNIFDPSGGLSFGQCLLQTFQVIFVAGNVKDAGVATHPEFNTFVFWFSWICIIAALGFADIEVAQLSAARGKAVGPYTMMTANNPVFILSGGGADAE